MVRYLLAAAAALCLAAPAEATTFLYGFESNAPGDTAVSQTTGVGFGGIVESGGPTGNYLSLWQLSGFQVPTAMLTQSYSEFLEGGHVYSIRSVISSFDVMLPNGGTMLLTSGLVLNLAAGQWYHEDVNNPYSIKFHADGVFVDNISGSQFISQVPEPSTWAMLLLGFGLIGCAIRVRPRAHRPMGRLTA